MKKLLALALAFFCMSAFAESVIKFVTIGGVGSQGDTAIRYLSPLIEREAGRNSIIVNRPGGNGVLALNEVFIGTPMSKGETPVLIGSALLAYLHNTDKSLSVDPMSELEPLYGLTRVDSVFLVPANSPVKTLQDLKRLRESSGRVVAGSMSAMTSITINMVDQKLGMKSDIIMYRAPVDLAINMTMGLIDYALAPAGGAAFQGFIDSGKLRPIAVIANKRNVSYPNLPCTLELGLGGIEDFGWTAFFVKKSTPEPEKRALASAIERALKSKDAEGFSQLLGKPQIWFADAKTVRGTQTREQPFLLEPKE